MPTSFDKFAAFVVMLLLAGGVYGVVLAIAAWVSNALIGWPVLPG